MKQSQTSDQVTKQYLKDLLIELRQDIRQEIRSSEQRVLAKVGIKFEDFERKMDDKLTNLRSDILTRFDNWAGELDSARIDRTITTNQITKLSDKVNDHDKRIKKLEKN